MDGSTKVLIGVAVAVWGAAGFFFVQRQGDPAASAAPAPEVEATGAAAAPASAPPPTPTASAPSSASSAPPSEAPVDTKACLRRSLPPPIFEKSTDSFAWLCEKANPLRGASALRKAIVTDGNGKLTPAMTEWAGLGWYQVAAYQVLRTRCCADPVPYEWPFSLACPIDEAVEALGKAEKSGDDAAIDAAIATYRAQSVCLDKFGQSSNFGQAAPPGSGLANFKKIVQRR